jgi:hypothetical protein
MSTTDYIVDIALILVIFWQVRPRELTAGAVILPLAIIAYAGFHYLHRFTVAGNDVLLMAVLALVGVLLGSWSGLATRVWREHGRVLSRAGVLAAATWITGMGFRFAFALYANTAGGDQAIGRFSAQHSITSSQAWTTALVLMAFAEVLARVAIMQWRRIHARETTIPWAMAAQGS